MKIILLPGLDGTGHLFEPFVHALPTEVEASVISYPADSALSYTELVDFVSHKLPKEDFFLLGESFSGPIVYQLALPKYACDR